jgi:hypothetical protein
MDETSHLLPPWRVTEHSEQECYSVEDANSQNIAYIYFAEDPARRRSLGRLTKDEARKIANGIARLPELLVK